MFVHKDNPIEGMTFQQVDTAKHIQAWWQPRLGVTSFDRDGASKAISLRP